MDQKEKVYSRMHHMIVNHSCKWVKYILGLTKLYEILYTVKLLQGNKEFKNDISIFLA